MKISAFWVCVVLIFLAGLGLTHAAVNPYYFNALYVILQATIMAVAWNILGGFTGYVNFGSAAFFAVGAYTAIALDKALGLPLPFLIMAAALVCGLIGLGVGYLTLRLKGVYFAIVVLGGMGSIPGMFLAAMILGIAESLVGTFMGPSWAPAVAFGLLLLTLAIRPSGLFGRQ